MLSKSSSLRRRASRNEARRSAPSARCAGQRATAPATRSLLELAFTRPPPSKSGAAADHALASSAAQPGGPRARLGELLMHPRRLQEVQSAAVRLQAE